MSSKIKFQNIPRKDLHKIASEILKNAEYQLEVAELLAKNKRFAPANSHNILALEEFIKALVLYFDGIGFRFRSVNELNALFLNHEMRYFISFFIFFGSVFDDDITLLCSYLNENKGGFDEMFNAIPPNKKDNIIKLIGGTLGTIVISGYLNLKLETIEKEIEFFKQIKLTRENCNYTGYNDKVLSPLDFTEEQFTAYSTRIYKVINVIKILNKQILDETNFITDLKKQINNALFYKTLDDELKKIKSNNFDSFLSGFKLFVDLYTEKSAIEFLKLFLSEILPLILTKSIEKTKEADNTV